jgi:transcriptional regulator
MKRNKPMYIPAVFAERDLTRLHDFIEQHSFGVLVSQVEGLPFATHLPFLLQRQAGPYGSLIGHMARANPQWQHAGGQTALAMFSGPHAYVSPTWYESAQVVPTWDYTAVHVYGPIQIVEDRDTLLEIVQKSVHFYEQAMPQPWSFADTGVYAERMLAQIVGFRIPIEKIEGKWKLNQNHPVERRKKVAQALRERQDENSQAVADLIEEALERDTRRSGFPA